MIMIDEGMTLIDEAIREKLSTALLSPGLHLGSGLGSKYGRRCTIAEINLVLTGNLTDLPHPCISEVIRNWVICVQDSMPDEMRNSAAWRTAAIGIAGSAASDEVEKQRAALILNWMWDALGDDAVLASIPESARLAWATMLTERTSVSANPAASYAAYYAVSANAAAARAVWYAVYAVVNTARAVVNTDAYWERRNPAKLLTELLEVR